MIRAGNTAFYEQVCIGCIPLFAAMSTSERPADLRSWLSTEAGLKGARLESTLEKCRVGEIFSLDEMRELAAMPALFKENFPAPLTRGKIAEALAKDTSNRDAVQTEQDTNTFENISTAQPAKIGGVQGLPEGKRSVTFRSFFPAFFRSSFLPL